MIEAMDAEPQEMVSAEGGAMPDNELAAFLSAHESQAVGYYTSEIADEQALSLDYYYGRPFGDEQEGRSQVVDRTVQIVIDNATAALIKPFLSADDTVVFEPKGPEDEEAAKQATEYVNYVFQVENNGFLLMHNWFKAALLEKIGVVKCWWEDKDGKSVERLTGLDAAQLEMVLSQEKVIGGPYQDEDEALFAVDIEREYKDGCIRIITVPSEEFLIAPFARDIETAEYVAHRPTNVTRSDLLDMGFDPVVVDGLSAAVSDQTYESRAQSRWQDENFANTPAGNSPDRAMDRIAVVDEFVFVDYNGDGVAERRHIIRVGDEILFNEETDDCPFSLLCPVPMPHKVYGLSLADLTRDSQRISSVLWRQTLDNLYLANNPKVEVPRQAVTEDGATFDDLADPAPGGFIRTAAPNMINPLTIPFVADKSFPMLEYVSVQAEERTGVSRTGQGLDREALRKSGQMTATEIAQISEGKNARMELIARIFAETGVKRLFKLMLKLLIQHQPRERVIRLRNQWVPMDPRNWNAEMDVSITVGLGVGSKAEQVAKADAAQEVQGELMQSPYGQLVGMEQIYHGAKRKLNAVGIKDTENYLQDPARIPPQPPQPDPEMIKVQAEAQHKQQQLAFQQEEAALKLRMQSEEQAQKQELARQQAEFEASLAERKAQAEFALAEQRLAQEMVLAERRMQMEEEMAQRKAAATEAKLSTNRPGGSLAE